MSWQTVGQAAVLGLHAILFLLFLRLFLWKRHAEQSHWFPEPRLTLAEVLTRARERGAELPFISIFIPAREEREVIERTLRHLVQLEYPPDRWEVIVITDEKEEWAARRQREALAAALAAEGRDPRHWPHGEAETAFLALLCRLALEAARRAQRRADGLLDRLLALPPHQQEELLLDAVADLWQQGAPRRPARWFDGVRHRLSRQWPSLASPALAAAVFLLAVGVLAAARRLRGDVVEEDLLRQLLCAARPHPSRRLAAWLVRHVPAWVIRRLEQLRRSGQLAAAVQAACAVAWPTTQEVVGRCLQELSRRSDVPPVKHASVPFDYDGLLDGGCTGREVPSTKGRALNFGARLADPRSQIFGYYDAEARPHPRVLLHVAWRRLAEPERPLLLQGPVFQVRNFHRLGPLNKIAALYQAVSHHWYLPVLMRHLPFIGGTNFFIDRRLFETVGGFDPSCLSEDLEIGVRAAIRAGAWPQYLPVPASEQTPPTFRAYFRQRLRWGCGWLQVYRRLRELQPRDPAGQRLRRGLLRQLFLRGHVQWTLYQLLTLTVPVSWWLSARGWLAPLELPFWLQLVLQATVLPYLLFTWSCLFRYREYMDPSPHRGAMVIAAAQLVLLPLGAFCFPTPFSTALALYALGVSPNGWVKTPRTAE